MSDRLVMLGKKYDWKLHRACELCASREGSDCDERLCESAPIYNVPISVLRPDISGKGEQSRSAFVVDSV